MKSENKIGIQKDKNEVEIKIILVFKYIIMAIIVGIVVGIIDTIFGRGLIEISDFRNKNYKFLLPFLPIAGLFITWMYHKFNELSLKGMTLVFETRQQKRNSIPLALVPLVMVGTWITHLFGGSAGREGVAVQIGATLSHAFGKKLKMPDNSKVMLITGMAAGFGGLFQTPLTAIFFAMEVIVTGYMDYEAMLPAMIGAFVASFTSHTLGLEKFEVNLNQTINMTDAKNVIAIIVLGIAFGIVGRLFSVLLQKSKKFMSEKIANPYMRIGMISIPLAICLLFIFSGRYTGLGTNLISEALGGNEVYYYDWILKLLFTIVTLAIGFQGGEVTPLFSIGATLGVALGSLFGISPIVCGALGYAAVFGSATNTLIAPIMIGIEVFGGTNMLPFVIVCAVAYIVNGNASIYSAQQKSVM